MDNTDLAELRRAKAILENPGLAMKLANAVGRPVEWALTKAPKRFSEIVGSSTKAALDKALDIALYTLDRQGDGPPKNLRHRVAVWGLGAAGGSLGLVGLPLELPFSTTVMLRSIADHARSQGEDTSSPEARLNCLLVFALGGRSASDNAAEAGYFMVRSAFAKAVTEAAEHMATRIAGGEVAEKSAPALVRLITSIGVKFGIAVESKAAAQLVPVIGAGGGALLNEIFITHFQNVAWGHFTVRRLERKYGPIAIQTAYAAA